MAHPLCWSHHIESSCCLLSAQHIGVAASLAHTGLNSCASDTRKHRAVEHVHFGFVGANVRQQHEDGVVLFFDVELQWANALQRASICIQAQANSKWTALKAVEAPASGIHVHTIQVTLHLMLHGLCLLSGDHGQSPKHIRLKATTREFG